MQTILSRIIIISLTQKYFPPTRGHAYEHFYSILIIADVNIPLSSPVPLLFDSVAPLRSLEINLTLVTSSCEDVNERSENVKQNGISVLL